MQKANRLKLLVFLILLVAICISCWKQKDTITIENDGTVNFESEVIVEEKDFSMKDVDEISDEFMQDMVNAGWKITKKWVSKELPYKLLFTGTGNLKKVSKKTDFYVFEKVNGQTYKIKFIPAESEKGKSSRSIVFKKNLLGGNAEIYDEQGNTVTEIQNVFEHKEYTIKLKSDQDDRSQFNQPDGVYLLTGDDKLIQLENKICQSACAFQAPSGYQFAPVRPTNGEDCLFFLTIKFCSLPELKNIPVVEEGMIKGVYIKSTSERITRLNQLALMRDYFENAGIGEANSVNYVVQSGWGLSASSLTFKTIDESTIFATITGLDAFKTGSVSSSKKANIFSLGLYIQTKARRNHMYPFFTTTALNMFLWNMHETQQYIESYNFFLERLENNTSNPNCLDTVAWVYKDHGDQEKAIQIYTTRILPTIQKTGDSEQIAKFNKYFEEIQMPVPTAIPQQQEKTLTPTPVSTATPQQQEKTTTQKIGIVVTEQDDLNIRSGPGKQHKVVGKAGKDTKLSILEELGEWYKVQLSDGTIGYATIQYIKIFNEKKAASTHESMEIPPWLNRNLRQKDQWKAEIIIKCLEIDNICGSIDFRGLQCGGDLKYIGRKNNGFLFMEKLKYGRCVEGCYIWLNLDGTRYKEICNNKEEGSGELQ